VKTPSSDWDREERVALEPLEEELRALRNRHASDPPLDRLRAASADALPADLQASTAEHLAESRWSRTLVEGAAAGSGDLGVDDEVRLFKRIQRDRRSGHAPRGFRPVVWSSLLAASAAAVLAVVIVERSRPAPVGSVSVAPIATATAAPPQPTATRFQLPLDKPDVKLSPRALTYRGVADGRDFASQLKPALDAYREGDYGRADREFTALATRYPQAVEVFFYQGVARLFLNDFAGADVSLATADRLSDESFATEVAWYCAVVDERLGRLADARARLASLCTQGNHSHQRSACEAADRMK
jgi:TolA-binding protein